MSKMTNTPLICGLLMAVIAVPSHAETFSDEPIDAEYPFTVQLDTIVITATRTDKSLMDSPVPISVISSDQIDTSQARTLKEALELLPNVTLRKVHGKTGFEIIMQGLSSDQVLVLIDGLPLTASTGSSVNLSQYLNTEVAQVEVIQGASSAQFGSSAMGGVINVITKPIDADLTDAERRKRISGSATLDIATNTDQNPSGKDRDVNAHYVDAHVDARLDTAGHWLTRISASQRQDAGLSLDTEDWTRIKDNSSQSQLTGKLVYRPIMKAGAASDDTQVWLEMTQYSEEDSSRFKRQVAQNRIKQQKEERIDKTRYVMGFNHKQDNKTAASMLAGSSLQGKFMLEDYHSASDTVSVTHAGNVPSIDRDAHIKTKLGQLQWDLPSFALDPNDSLDSLHLVQLGIQWQEDELSQTNNGNNELIDDQVSRDVSEIYVQDDWLFGSEADSDWELVTGIRYQNDSDFGDHVAPKVALKYSRTDALDNQHIWRASVGQGYRVPNLKERHFVFDHSVYGYKVQGNPELNPETSISYQLGYQGLLDSSRWGEGLGTLLNHALGNQIRLTANVFYNKVADLIQADLNHPLVQNNIATYQYRNIDSATTYGGDLGVIASPTPTTQLQVNYGYTHTEDDTTGSELVGRPRHQASLAISHRPQDNVTLTNRLHYVSRQLVNTSSQAYSPSYYRWDATADYRINDHFSIHAGVDNVLNDQRDFTDPNDQTPYDNRRWRIGANFTF